MALVLLVLCISPLLHPHAYMLQEEKRFVKEVELDRAVDMIHSSLLEKLHKNEIDWNDIENRTWKKIDATLMQHDPLLWKKLPYQGEYCFHIKKHKGDLSSPEGIHYHIEIPIVFYPASKKALSEKDAQKTALFEYKYQAVITRKLPSQSVITPSQEPPEPKEIL